MTKADQDLLSLFADNLPGAAFSVTRLANGTQNITFMNAGCQSIFGVSAADVDADPNCLWAMVHPDDRAAFLAHLDGIEPCEVRCRIKTPDGVEKHVLGRGTPQRRKDGTITWLTFVFDISDETRAKEEATRSTKNMTIIGDAIPDAFALFSPDERLIVSNALYAEVHGFDREADLTGLRHEEIVVHAAQLGAYPDARTKPDAWISEQIAQFRDATAIREERYRQDRWMRLLDRPTRDGGRVSFRIEITEARQRQSRLEHAVATDILTGLFNRRGLGDRLECVRSSLAEGEHIALLHIDLDKFKTINDVAGHEAGDTVLIEVARRLSETAPDGALVARIGGDEFIVVLQTSQSEVALVHDAERMRSCISEPIFYHGRLCQVGCSIGIASWSVDDCATLEQRLLDADTALLRGKALGRNQVVTFHDDMRAAAIQTAEMAARIKDGLRKSQFIPFFQPQLELPGNRVCGLETLARWRDDNGSIIPAGDFVAVADETGLINQVDRQMQAQSLAAYKALQEKMIEPPLLSINLSGVQLSDPDILERLLDELLEREISTERIAVEILESTLLDDRSDIVARNVHLLARYGFRIELDDFGTGHTALASLQQFPVHRIKIDRSLVRAIDSDAATRAITEGIFELCQKLGVETIAEGVETQAELSTLMDIGITQFQGFLLGRPMAIDELVTWLDKRGDLSHGDQPGKRDGTDGV